MKLQAEDIVMMGESWQYRNKVVTGFQRDRQCRMQAGFCEEFSHRIILCKCRPLHSEVCDNITVDTVELMGEFHVEPYNEDRRKGLIRHVVVQYGVVGKQIMIALVLNSNVFPVRRNFIRELRRRFLQITAVVQNANTRKTSMVLRGEECVLYGLGYIEDVLCGMTSRISAKSSYQISHGQTEVLYQRSVELLELGGKETVLDAYCGVRTIGVYVSYFVKQMVGTGISRDTIEDTKINTKINQIFNIHFVCRGTGRYTTRPAAEEKRLDVVAMDPPRSGSSEEFIKSLIRMKPKQVLCILCNPQTQIRGLQMFERMGYRVQGKLVSVDMFPHMVHVETVVLLPRLKTKKHINMELHTDELDLIASESKTTYAKIKQYVLEKHGIRVPSSNIV